MIHYQLHCSADHRFDGWFKSSAAFDDQAGRGLIACPECGDVRVNRALMAPAIGRTAVTISAEPQPEPVPAPTKEAAAMPDRIRAALQRIRAEIERTSDYVGTGFADEARRIHRGESERRSIYGESSPAEAESLAEDGIEFAHIPWVPKADA